MIEKAETVSRQVDILRSTGELSPKELETIAIRLQEYAEEAEEPLFVRALLGAGAWSAAILTMLSVQFVLQGKGLLFCGVALLVLAVGLSRAGKGIFVYQLTLALAVVGNIGILVGAASILPGELLPAMTTLQFALCLILYPLLSNAAFRFAAPVSAVGLVAAWIAETGTTALFHLLVAAELGIFFALSVRSPRVPACFPLEAAATLLLPMTFLIFHLDQLLSPIPHPPAPLWPSGLLLCAGLIFVLFHPLVAQPGVSGLWKFGFLLVSLLPGLFTSPGVCVAMILLLLGRARDDRYLTVLGGLTLPVFLGFSYHTLDIDLTHKSWVIAGSGLLLLGLRQLLAHICPGGETA